MKFIGYLFLIIIVFAGYSYITLPDFRYVSGCFTTSMNHVYLCSKSPHYVRLSQISPNIKNAIIISEDAAFYSHNGFDLDEIKDSFKKNLEKGKFARGGSTISQQLTKNLFLSQDKSILRKVKELILTYRIEQAYKKDVILEKYLNVIELGPNIYGVKDGAQYYFQKSPSQVSPIEGAFLAFLLPNPKRYSESYKKKELTPFARSRLKDILFKMHYYKKITDDEYQTSLEQLARFFKPIPEIPGEQEDFANDEDTSRSYDLSIPETQKKALLEIKNSTLQEPQNHASEVDSNSSPAQNQSKESQPTYKESDPLENSQDHTYDLQDDSQN